MMERRRSRRIKVSIEARIISDDENCSGIIENIAEHGICLETDSKDLLRKTTHFNPGTEYEIKFQMPSEEEIKLHCRVMWSYKTAPHGLKRKTGLEIIFPPPSYVDFCRNLDSKEDS